MSYEVRGKGTLVIKKEDYMKVITALKDAFPDQMDGIVEVDPNNLTQPDIKEIFRKFGFKVSFDDSGDIHDVMYPWRASSTLDRFLSTIEDMVQEESLIIFEGEDGESWSWPEKRTSAADISSEVIAELDLQIDASDAEEIIEAITNWVASNEYDVDLDDSGLCELLESLFSGSIDVSSTTDDDDREIVIMEGTALFVEVNFPIPEFIEVIAPFVIESNTTLRTENADYEPEFKDGKVTLNANYI